MTRTRARRSMMRWTKRSERRSRPLARRRRKRYHTGVHTSPKLVGPCEYRSGWELALMGWFDVEPTVLRYSYESVRIPYLSNARSRKVRNYLPDFLVELADGRRILVEVKPSKKLGHAQVKKKLAAAQSWCNEHGIALQVITEHDLRALGVL